MIKLLCVIWFKRSGWRFVGTLPKRLEKVIFVVGPQTSPRDLIFALAIQELTKFKVRVCVDRGSYKWYNRWFIRRAGGVQIDRESSEKTRVKLVNKINERSRSYLAISFNAPQDLSAKGDLLFYKIALNAETYIVLVAFDHRRKVIKFHTPFKLSGIPERDLGYVNNFFLNYFKYYQQLKGR